MPTDLLTPDACRAGLATALAAIPGIGQVHRRRRIARDDREVTALFMTGGIINAWLLSFAPTNAAMSHRQTGFNAIGTPGGGRVLTTFLFQIEGYYGVDDANNSEETFANLAWLIAQTLNSYGLLAITGLVMQDACDLVQVTYAMLAGKFLTHYAKLTIALQGCTQ